MLAMYLTDKKNNLSRELHDHEDLEVLLETFAKQVEEIVNEAQNMEVRMYTRSWISQLVDDLRRATYNLPRKL